MPYATVEDIRKAFHAVQSTVASDPIAQRAVNICNEFDVTAEKLATHWESFSLNHTSFDGNKLTSRAVDALRSLVKRQEMSRLKRQARATTFRAHGTRS